MLSDDEILDIATAAGLRFSMYSDDVETRAAIKRLARAVEPRREPLSDRQLASVCMSYRHDFGLLDDAEQVRLLLEARAWERAFRKEWQR